MLQNLSVIILWVYTHIFIIHINSCKLVYRLMRLVFFIKRNSSIRAKKIKISVAERLEARPAIPIVVLSKAKRFHLI